MGIFDAAKNTVADLAAQHPDKVESLSDQAIERAGGAADAKSGGKFTSQVDSAQAQADQRVVE